MSGSSDQRAPAGSLRELFQVAVPLILSAGSMMLMHFVDRMYLTWYSEATLAASLPASMLNWTIFAVAFGTVSYVNSFVSQYDGAGRPERISGAVWQAVYLGGLMCLATVPFAVAAWVMIPAFGHGPDVVAAEREFFALLCVASVPMIISTALSAFYSGRGKTGEVLKVNVLMLAINVCLDPLLIFGWGPVPSLGILGAGLATIVTSFIGTAAYLRMFLRPRERQQYGFWKHRQWDGALLGRMLRYGLPNGFQSLGDAAAFTLFLFLVGSMNRTALAATNLAFNINMLIFIPMLGVGTAVTVLVGRHVGEGRPDLAARSTWMAMLTTGSVTLLFCTAFLTLPHVLLQPFRRYASPDEFSQVEPLVLGLLKFVAVYSVFDAMFIVFGSAVKSAGDTRMALIVNMLSAWCLMVFPVALMQFTGTLTLTRCWICCSAHIMTCGAVFFLRFLYGPWRSMKVIESSREDRSAVSESLNSQNGSDSGKIGGVVRTGDADDPHRDELDSHATKTAT